MNPESSWIETGCCRPTDIIWNFLLFAPFGLALGLAGAGRWPAITVGALASSAIEIAQRGIPGRVSSLEDVASNTLGALAGVLLATEWSSRGRWWRIVGRAGAAVAVIMATASAVLTRPATLTADPWWGQWAHQFRGTGQFEGRILDFTLQGLPIPDGPLAESDILNHRLKNAESIRLDATVVSAPLAPPSPRAQLVGIVAGNPGPEYLGLWQEERSLLGFVRLRLTDPRLRAAWFRLENALPQGPGDTLRLSMAVTGDRVSLAVEEGPAEKQRSYPLSSMIFWADLVPFQVEAGTGVLGWALIPLGLAFVVIGAGTRNVFGALCLSLLALLAGPLLTGSAVVPWPAVATAILGAMAGRSLAFRLGFWTRTPPRPRRSEA